MKILTSNTHTQQRTLRNAGRYRGKGVSIQYNSLAVLFYIRGEPSIQVSLYNDILKFAQKHSVVKTIEAFAIGADYIHLRWFGHVLSQVVTT